MQSPKYQKWPIDKFVDTQYFKSLLRFIFYTVSFGSSRASSIRWSKRDVWCYFCLIELFWIRICEFRTHLDIRVSVFGHLLSPSELYFVFTGLTWTPMAPRRELTIVRAQGKHLAKASQPEARRKRHFDTALEFQFWVS